MKEIVIFVHGITTPFFMKSATDKVKCLEEFLIKHNILLIVLYIEDFGIKDVNVSEMLIPIIEQYKNENKKVHVLAHSFGSFESIKTLSKYNKGKMVDSLILLNPAGIFTHGGVFGYYLSIFFKLFYPIVGKYITFNWFYAFWNSPCLLELSELGIPTSLVYSKYDILYPVLQGNILSKLLNVPLFVLNTGHALDKSICQVLLQAITSAKIPSSINSKNIICKYCSAFFMGSYDYKDIIIDRPFE
jgi:pimeloyl-ACP methyl ester carboxylesterase